MTRYSWANRGDINAFFGLMLDNVAVMVILVTSISAASAAEALKESKFTSEFVLTRMIPGTALGVLFGDLVYTVLAFRLARRLRREDVTAMPLGLDTPSTFGVAFLVLLPALQDGVGRYQLDHASAMNFAWHVGLTVLVLIGVIKVVLSPLGNAVRRLVPRAGLLGSLAAIALAMIAFLPMLLNGIAAVPLVGMVALLLILLTQVAQRELPGRFPGALAAVLVGVLLYRFGLFLGGIEGWPVVPALSEEATVVWHPTAMFPFSGQPLSWWGEVLAEALRKLPIMFPFALATVVGGIDCTESAAAAGDEYDTRSILLTEGLTSVLAGLLGGVIQTTPYIGHPAYKKMGGRAAYTLATALFIGLAGYFGWFTLLFAWLPQSAMFPILVFVGLEITAQSFHATPVKHYPALALAVLPALAYLITIALDAILPGQLPTSIEGKQVLQTLRCLANGFLITSLLWAAALALILDGRLYRAAGTFAIAGLCALVGIIHSPLKPEKIDLPHNVLAAVDPALRDVAAFQTPYHWAGAYVLMALVLVVLELLPVPQDPALKKGTQLISPPAK